MRARPPGEPLWKAIGNAALIGAPLVTESEGPLPGADLERDLYPRLVAGTVGVAISASTELWLRLGPPASYGELLQDALDQVTRGLPLPTGPASGRSG
ncbi:hypothetical protein GCM10010149_51300 [Nonomuraea roseoviolacea subsp. roseoviolacea]|uniref:acyl-CoA-like ligand-binding transcription factor n=1 Tax=Nonomuraea roseoviolacea TaxID=103837 RepID=UPI0031E1F3B0